jgi:hypothetical protein
MKKSKINIMKSIFFTILLAFLSVGSGYAAPDFEKIKIRESRSLNRGVVQTFETMAFFDVNEQKIGEDKKASKNLLPVAKRTFAKMFAGYRIKQAVRSIGGDGECYYIFAENDNESILIKIDKTLDISIFTNCKK